MRTVSAHLRGQLIFALSQIDDMSQHPIRRRLAVANFYDHLGAHQCTRESTSGEPKRLLRGGAIASRIFSTKGLKALPQAF
jgi:hypothetical protein